MGRAARPTPNATAASTQSSQAPARPAADRRRGRLHPVRPPGREPMFMLVSPPLRTRLADRHQQQALQRLGRDLRRRHRRRRDDRPLVHHAEILASKATATGSEAKTSTPAPPAARLADALANTTTANLEQQLSHRKQRNPAARLPGRWPGHGCRSKVDLLGGAGRPHGPGRVFIVGPAHTFEQGSRTRGGSPRSRAGTSRSIHQFELADGRLIGYPDDSYAPDLVWLDHAKLKVAREVKPEDEFELACSTSATTVSRTGFHGDWVCRFSSFSL